MHGISENKYNKTNLSRHYNSINSTLFPNSCASFYKVFEGEKAYPSKISVKSKHRSKGYTTDFSDTVHTNGIIFPVGSIRRKREEAEKNVPKLNRRVLVRDYDRVRFGPIVSIFSPSHFLQISISSF